MATDWRQGDIVAPEQAVALELLSPEQALTHRAIAISHSCDIARDASVEPHVEVIIAKIVSADEASGARNGHSIRKLNISAIGRESTEWLELDILDKKSVEKAKLLAEKPWREISIHAAERGILQKWLAQRYSRSEFPNAFIEWLFRDSGVGKQFEKIAKRYSGPLVAIYFDLDDDSERHDPDQPYPIGIYLAYSTSSSEFAQQANEAADELTQAFKTCCQGGSSWRWFELLYCEAISDDVFTLRAANEFRRWRFEHRSIAGEPFDASDM